MFFLFYFLLSAEVSCSFISRVGVIAMYFHGDILSVALFALYFSIVHGYSINSTISTYAGYTISNFDKRGDGDVAAAATISVPFGIYADSFDNIFITESQYIRRISGSMGTISTYAGGGDNSLSNDILASQVLIVLPYGIAGDTASNIYYADSSQCCVRKISAGTLRVNTVVGECGTTGPSSSSASSGLSARLSQPRGLFYYSPNNVLYIVDSANHVVLAYYVKTDVAIVVAGLVGSSGYNGEGAATSYSLSRPSDVFVDSAQNLYITDSENFRVRFVQNSTRTMSTVAGNGAAGSAGNGGPVSSAPIQNPSSVCLDASGDMFVFSVVPNQVRVVSNGVINTPVASSSQVRYPCPHFSKQQITILYYVFVFFSA